MFEQTHRWMKNEKLFSEEMVTRDYESSVAAQG
jgi:hypothetical protein